MSVDEPDVPPGKSGYIQNAETTWEYTPPPHENTQKTMSLYLREYGLFMCMLIV